MGKPMSATPTPEIMVGQGGANILENRCPTTPPLTGRRGWWGAHHLFGVGWGKFNQSRSINDNSVVSLRRARKRYLSARGGAGHAVGFDLVPIHPILNGQGTGAWGHAFALCLVVVTDVVSENLENFFASLRLEDFHQNFKLRPHICHSVKATEPIVFRFNACALANLLVDTDWQRLALGFFGNGLMPNSHRDKTRYSKDFPHHSLSSASKSSTTASCKRLA